MAVNFNSLYNDYLSLTQNGGKIAGGAIKADDFQNSIMQTADGVITIKEADGDTFTFNAANYTNSTTNPKAVTTTKTTKKGGPLTKEEIDAEISRLESEISSLENNADNNTSKVNSKNSQVSELQNRIQAAYSSQNSKLAKVEAEKQQKAAEITAQEIAKYKASNGKMTKAELMSNLSSAISGISNEYGALLAAIALEASDIEGLEGDIASLTSEIEQLNNANQNIFNSISDKQNKISDLNNMTPAETTTTSTTSYIPADGGSAAGIPADGGSGTAIPSDTFVGFDSTEPQGFQVQNENGTTTQYDFFVDKDGNGQLSNAMEFLGAEADRNGLDGWTEMQRYDIDNNGTIDMNELSQAEGLMVMETVINADGTKTQQAKSITEAFGKDSDLSINANKDKNTNSAVGPDGFYDSKYNNTLLGTFGVTYKGEKITGYQTDDDNKYLNDYYTFTDGSAEGKTEQSVKSTNPFSNMFEESDIEINGEAAQYLNVANEMKLHFKSSDGSYLNNDIDWDSSNTCIADGGIDGNCAKAAEKKEKEIEKKSESQFRQEAMAQAEAEIAAGDIEENERNKRAEDLFADKMNIFKHSIAA